MKSYLCVLPIIRVNKNSMFVLFMCFNLLCLLCLCSQRIDTNNWFTDLWLSSSVMKSCLLSYFGFHWSLTLDAVSANEKRVRGLWQCQSIKVISRIWLCDKRFIKLHQISVRKCIFYRFSQFRNIPLSHLFPTTNTFQ